MAKTKKNKKTRSKTKMTFSIGIIGGFAPGILDTLRTSTGWRELYNNTGDDMVSVLAGDFTGLQTKGAQAQYSGGKVWSSWRLKYGLYPALIGTAAHWIANRFGINRMIARAGIPLIRI